MDRGRRRSDVRESGRFSRWTAQKHPRLWRLSRPPARKFQKAQTPRMEEPNAEMGMPTGELKGITFYLMTNTEMEKSSSASIVEPSDVSSAKLGLPNGAPQCETCGAQSVRECDGHSGVIKLPATVFNPHLFEEVVQLLNQICPGCHTPKQNRDSK
uniref:DNA-directed RNA polymerase n=1 Tax=Aegilops tauschii subsp. strangulata TaxID=200361 RepID=A0A452Y2I3_AEGTS